MTRQLNQFESTAVYKTDQFLRDGLDHISAISTFNALQTS